MIDLSAVIKDETVRRISGPAGAKKVREGFMDGMRQALALIERHHKRHEMVRLGGRLSSGDQAPPHYDKLTVRTGALSRSYTRRLLKNEMAGAYGSDLVYAPVHEFGSTKLGIHPRPGLARTIDAKADEVEKILADHSVKEL